MGLEDRILAPRQIHPKSRSAVADYDDSPYRPFILWFETLSSGNTGTTSVACIDPLA